MVRIRFTMIEEAVAKELTVFDPELVLRGVRAT